ncbi:MAG: ATP-binding protein [Armatimonadetes bacterium]|nr:ATP-binding protein [Armatimonadota bacterium]
MITLRNIDSPQRGVIILDKDHKISFANRRASEIFGVAIEQLIGSDLPGAVLHREMGDEDIVEEVLESWCDQGATFHRYSTPVFAADGVVSGRVEIYSDITARRMLEEEILERNTELAELNAALGEAQEQLVHSERLRTLGEMAAGVAHDINNVLGIILGNAQLAKRKLGEDSDVRRSIDAIELAARDGAETVHRLREIGKPVDSASYKAVDLNDIVNDVVRGAVPAWKESGLHDGVSVETNLAPGCRVLGNAAELREALANVLMNAAQAIEGKGNISISTSIGDGYALMTIKDTGLGMSEETLERLFDPFFTTRGAQGTGLGMSMVDAIVIRHGGKAMVDSEEGIGTEVTFCFPACDDVD